MLRQLAIYLSLAFPLAGCMTGESQSANVSKKGQLIECTAAPDGSQTCTPTDNPTGMPGSCVDVDDDGDDDPHDTMDDDDDDGAITGDVDDDDGDGISNEDDDDDDNDGIPDTDDCDELPGGDSDDAA
jgi:hypothetical protein